MAVMYRHGGALTRRLLFSLAGAEAIETVIAEESEVHSAARLTSEVLACEKSVRRQLRIVGPIEEIDRALVACGVDKADQDETVKAVLASVHALHESGGSQGTDSVARLLKSGVSDASVVYVATRLLQTDLFDYVHDELHDLISDMYEDA